MSRQLENYGINICAKEKKLQATSGKLDIAVG
jgi:hypothetical protein